MRVKMPKPGYATIVIKEAVFRKDNLKFWCGRRDLNPGRRRGSSEIIIWSKIRDDFREYVNNKYAPRSRGDLIRYLDRFVGSKRISSTMDVLRLFNGLSVGQRHHLNRALRALFNYFEMLGGDANFLDGLRKAIPKDRIGIDLHVPEPNEIKQCLMMLPLISLK